MAARVPNGMGGNTALSPKPNSQRRMAPTEAPALMHNRLPNMNTSSKQLHRHALEPLLAVGRTRQTSNSAAANEQPAEKRKAQAGVVAA